MYVPLQGGILCSDRTDLLEPFEAGPLRVEVHLEQVSQGGSRHCQTIHLTFQIHLDSCFLFFSLDRSTFVAFQFILSIF